MSKGNYTKSEKFYKHIEESKKEVTGVNENYWNDFAENSGKSKGSLVQYRSACRRYFESINKDVLQSKVEDLENYLEQFEEGKTRENQKRYINSFLVFTISNNLEKAIKNTSSDLILNLIPSEYKVLIKVLMNK